MALKDQTDILGTHTDFRHFHRAGNDPKSGERVSIVPTYIQISGYIFRLAVLGLVSYFIFLRISTECHTCFRRHELINFHFCCAKKKDLNTQNHENSQQLFQIQICSNTFFLKPLKVCYKDTSYSLFILDADISNIFQIGIH